MATSAQRWSETAAASVTTRATAASAPFEISAAPRPARPSGIAPTTTMRNIRP